MPGSDLIQSLVRGLSILEFVAESESGLGLAEIAARLGVRAPTAHNLARTLVSRGYLEKRSRPLRYALGPAVPRIAGLGYRRAWFGRAEAGVRVLASRLPGATVLVGEPVGGEILACLRADPARPGLVERHPNWSLPPYTTAVAVCFQAFWARPERDAYRRRHPFAEFGATHWGTEEALEAELRRTRSRGYVLLANDPPCRVAAPVLGSGGELIACIGASVPRLSDMAESLLPEFMAETVVGVAAQLTAANADAEG